MTGMNDLFSVIIFMMLFAFSLPFGFIAIIADILFWGKFEMVDKYAAGFVGIDRWLFSKYGWYE